MRPLVLRRCLSTKHDFSVTPTTFNYRLPSRDYPYDCVLSPFSPFTPVFSNLSTHPLDKSTPSQFFDSFPLTNSHRLKKNDQRPTKVKMLASDFIEDSLYNPNYGYFPTQAEIFQTEKPFDYSKLKDSDEFMDKWQEQYSRYSGNGAQLQLWHTPTELFQPFYGEAIARYLLVNYKLNLYPYADLIIYEIGGGNGTLMMNILDYIKKNDPDVYSRTKYRIIEITKPLSEKQKLRSLHRKLSSKGHSPDAVQIINKSILDWDEVVPEPCFVIGMEVLDNLSHDVVKYDVHTGKPYQGYVVIDAKGDFHQFFTDELEEWTKLYLELRGNHHLQSSPWKMLLNDEQIHPLNSLPVIPKLQNYLSPFKNSLTESEFVPTSLLKLFNVLSTFFPEHQLLLADFDSLSETSRGFNAPVVQTMLDSKMATASTFMVHQGYFDIMFPTDFKVSKDIYVQMTGKLVETTKHEEFLNTWGDVEATRTKNGENLMLELYQNAAFLHS
ncbi:type II protein arginine methyltransferase [Cyberlindnera jadinii NRRL Y-1542]|uniref:Protein arginine methyltransferase NDUFAF7 n=1 Tax=Cyberlindnera jadinii (strain ATCC 18201 / CBS 1600 / BCRC 20928 / JCM 3617 / NBRC 0987 / NRRL Y-1542) TaxID=983966 RepID=A0A1E4S1D0_CYBJN|nr:DUF185-domain-containing protein [Cyberlindnera jadinii NRRL Y-1542]ODV73310.1 DUF185-domain-containing protein [Cyberlindnera jadinii NRRL Y-1542]